MGPGRPASASSCRVPPFSRTGNPTRNGGQPIASPPANRSPPPGPAPSNALIAAYKASPEWRQLSPRTRSERERHLELVAAKWGSCSSLASSLSTSSALLVLAVRWSDVDQGLIAVVQGKTGKRLWIPIHKELVALLAVLEARLRAKLGEAAAALDLRQCHEPILLNSRGKPWTVDGFKASWSEELNEPAMAEFRSRRLVFHGLRKSAVVFLLEAGCTDAETAAITGQSREMVEHYARQVNQRRLAAAAILKWETADAVRAADIKRGEGEGREGEGRRVCTTGPGICTTGRSVRKPSTSKHWSGRRESNPRHTAWEAPKRSAIISFHYEMCFQDP